MLSLCLRRYALIFILFDFSDPDFEKQIRQAAMDLKLQPEDNFILKVVQLQELFNVRHSVFIVGNTGTGKSQIWKTLNKTYQNQKKKPTAIDLNPKAVTNDELFGIINPTTREWKDGLFSVIMRDLANLSNDGPKWIVLDGDIDPMWIESLNTLMDDNKVLTLASNERIVLTPSMRLLFEIAHLRVATPATVSRAGILYINPGDLGWNPQVASWIDTREVQAEKANLTILFDKYCPMCIEAIKSRFKKITPIVENAHVHMLCNLLEVLLTPQNTPLDCPKDLYELYFVFACIWAFGSALFQDQVNNKSFLILQREKKNSKQIISSSLLIIALSSPNGGSPNSRRSSFQTRELSLTILSIQKLKNSSHGLSSCQSSHLIRIFHFR